MYTERNLGDISNNEVVRTSLDYSASIDPFIDQTLERWRANSMQRAPAPIYQEVIGGFPVFKGTDYDLSTFLMGLMKRGAVINIPEYERISRARLASNQRVVSPKNRHGQIIRLVSNKDAHSFSVQIMDYSVIETNRDGSETVGAPRNFAVVDYSGIMHPGWATLECRATPEERLWLEKNKLQPLEDTFEFRNFVHPEMAMFFYTPDYIVAKSLAQRCDDESAYYGEQVKSLIKMGIKLPPPELRPPGIKLPPPEIRPPIGYETPPVSYKTLEEPMKKVTVTRLVAGVNLPHPVGEPPILGKEPDGTIVRYLEMPRKTRDRQKVLKYALQRVNDMAHASGMDIRSVTSSVELATFLYGFMGERRVGNERLPPWIRDKWFSGIRGWQIMNISKEVILRYKLQEYTLETTESALTGYGSGLLVRDV